MLKMYLVMIAYAGVREVPDDVTDTARVDMLNENNTNGRPTYLDGAIL